MTADPPLVDPEVDADYFVLTDVEDDDVVDALLRRVRTPAGTVSQAFTWASTWAATDLFVRYEREVLGDLIGVDLPRAAQVAAALHARNAEHGFQRPL